MSDLEQLTAATAFLAPLLPKRRRRSGPHICPVCQKGFAWKSKLDDHTHAVHQKEIRYQCSYCDYRSFYLNHIQRHERRVHGDLNVYICRECGHRTASLLLLRDHHSTTHKGNLAHHTGEKYVRRVLRCGQCDHSTTHTGNLARHIRRVHTGEKYVERVLRCGQCDYSTTNKWHLACHVRVHTGEKSVKWNWKWTDCTNKFNLDSELAPPMAA